MPSESEKQVIDVSSGQEAHLIDVTNVPQVAEWVALTIASGALGGLSYDMIRDVLKMIFRRDGRKKLDEVKQHAETKLEQTPVTPNTDVEVWKKALDQVFSEFE